MVKEFLRQKPGSKIKKITIDQDLCLGCGACSALASEVFQIGENGKSEVVNPDGGDDEAIIQASQSCPVKAIAVS